MGGADGTPADSIDDPRAGRSRRAWIVFSLAAVVFVAADLASKTLAFALIADDPVVVERERVLEVLRADVRRLQTLVPDHDPVVVVPGVLELKLVLNAGAVFGAGPGRRWFFVGFTFVALGFAVFMFARWTRPDDLVTHLALALIVAGGLGNLYDRLLFACVRDFLHPLPGVVLPFGWTWPIGGGRDVWPYVSNAADAFLLIGIGVALIRMWSMERRAVEDAGRGTPGHAGEREGGG